MPGRASSPRMSMAMMPPTMKNVNEVARYIRPMVLWSVVRSRLDSREPFSATWTGLGRLTMGAGAIVTFRSLDGAFPAPRRDGTGTPVTGPARRAYSTSGRRPVGGDLDRDGDVERFREGGERRSGRRPAPGAGRAGPCPRASPRRPGRAAAARGARPSPPAPGAARAWPPAGRALSGSTRSRPSGPTSSPRWSAAGVTTTRRPSGRRTRAISGPLRGANTTSTRSTARVRAPAAAPSVSATTAIARGCARAARRAAYGGGVEHDADGVGQPVQHAGEVVPGAAPEVEQRPAATRRQTASASARVMPA